MAIRESCERYSHAVIDCSDMTLTEFCTDNVRTYDIMEILSRWNGVPDIEIEIRQRRILPADER